MTRATPELADERDRPIRGQSGFVGVLANGAFLRLWMAQGIGQTAQQTINFTLLIQVRQIAEQGVVIGPNTAVALLILCFATPPILFSALAGILVERADKRLIMAGVNLARAGCIAGYLFLNPDWSPLRTLLYIYVLCFSFSTTGQLFGPSEGSTIPRLVAHEQLISANALFGLTTIGAQLLGFVTLGPLLTQLLGLRTVYLTVVILYLFCTGLTLTLPRRATAPRPSAAGERHTIGGDLRELLGYLGRDPLLRKGIAYLTVANSALLMVFSLAPEFIVAYLRLPADRLAAVITPAGLGMVCGVIAVGRFGRRLDREKLIDRALIAVSTALLLFATVPPLIVALTAPPNGTILNPPVLVAMALAVGLGIGNAFIIVPSQTLLQERSTGQVRARVLSAFYTTSNTVALIPILFAGVLGDTFGVVRVLTAIALLALTGGLLAERARRRGARAVTG